MAAFSEAESSSWATRYSIPEPQVKLLPPLITFFLMIIFIYSIRNPKTNIPLLNARKPFEFSHSRPKKQFVSSAQEMLRSWFTAHPKDPIRMITDNGDCTVLPPHMANEIRNDNRLSFNKFIATAFHAGLPGFEVFHQASRGVPIVRNVVQNDLTKYLNKVTQPLADETDAAMKDMFTESTEWHEIPIRETILRLIARVSSRVFMGEELCRSERWLKIIREYTVTSFKAAEQLRMWPSFTRYIVHWFLLDCRKARAQVREARQIIAPVLEKRRQQKLASEAAGGKPAQFDDAIEWFERASKGSHYDPAIVQLGLSFAAIHTTSDLISQTVMRLGEHPEIQDPLRQEITTILGEGGWKKTSLYNMKLLDSVIKESQRMKPIGLTSMNRIALDTIKLSDGTVVPKDKMLAVMSSRTMWDPETYKDPERWDGYRFYEMRQKPGSENLAQLVTTSPDHLAWGHGQHACPGRFFAANEVKIVLIHLLTQYEFKLPGESAPKNPSYGFSLSVDPTFKFDIRRRC